MFIVYVREFMSYTHPLMVPSMTTRV